MFVAASERCRTMSTESSTDDSGLEAPKRSMVLFTDLDLSTSEPEYAAYPEPDAAFPFVWFDLILDHGEVNVALTPEDAREWGEALVRAANGCADD